MRTADFLLLIAGLVLLSSCKNKKALSIDGLWIVKSVTVEENTMTPNARWMRFNPDSTQQSGNGWFQHSVGRWSFNKKLNELSIVNTNGIKDTEAPFKVQMFSDSMFWNRIEQKQSVKVKLYRTEQLPTTFGDQLLGLWKLDDIVGEGDYFSKSLNDKDYLFFGWDKKFRISNNKDKINGVYNVHGHKPELELIPYNNKFRRCFWEVNLNSEAKIILKLLNTDSIVKRTFTRIHEFPK